MIISHKYRFIFLKTHKTAGTSIEVLLSRLCGEEDVITPITPAENGHQPRNYRGFFNPIPELRLRGKLTPMQDFIQRRRYLNHLPARRVKCRIGSKTWNSYYKFCFERNPWDKVVSYYWFDRKQQSHDTSFEAFVVARLFPVDYDIYSINNKLAVDFVGRYENLVEDLSSVLDLLGIKSDSELPHIKSGYRQHHNHYSDYYDNSTRKIVETGYAREIALLGYKFDSA